jgi:probable rRNA maturation factor
VSTFCGGVLCALDVPGLALGVVFVTGDRMRELNCRHRGKDYATDVLSFGYGGEVVEGDPFIGEIVIAPEVAWRQAHRWHGRPEREIRKLLVHGILHLLGYDHETDAGEMNRLQQRLMRSVSFEREEILVQMRSVR